MTSAAAQDQRSGPRAAHAGGAGRAAAEPRAALRRPGRPRSEQAGQAIIEAALDLFAEAGPEGLCIEQVAARAGVGKATIYRRWPGKEDLLLAALAALKSPLPEPQGKSVRADLIAILEAMRGDFADPTRRRLQLLLMGEGEKYPRLMERYFSTVIEPRREAVRGVLRRGVATGQLREDADLEAALFILVGASLVRGPLAPRQAAGYARRVIDELLRGLSAR
jgi:AcrR family transcriptional regulator